MPPSAEVSRMSASHVLQLPVRELQPESCADDGPAACRNVEALQAFSKNWLPLLFTAFLSTKTGQRGTISSTIAAYAAISEQSLLTGLFHTTLKKFLKVPTAAPSPVPALVIPASLMKAADVLGRATSLVLRSC